MILIPLVMNDGVLMSNKAQARIHWRVVYVLVWLA